MTSPAERYIRAARAAGCPKDQVDFLLRAGIVLQEQQLPIAAAARSCDHEGGPKQVCVGGNLGGGKSYALLALLVDDAIRFPGLSGLVLRKDKEAARDVVGNLLPQLLGGGGVKYKWAAGKLQFANGSVLRIGHFQTEHAFNYYLGQEYASGWIDEVNQLSKAQQVKIGSRFRNASGLVRPRLYTSTNPGGGPGHPWLMESIIRPWRLGTEVGSRFFELDGRKNPLLDPGYYPHLERTLTGFQRRAWLDGDWDVLDGVFFSNFLESLHVKTPEPLTDWSYWLSLDYGWAHWTVAYLFGQDPRTGHVYCLAEHAARQQHVKAHATQIKEMLGRWGLKPGRLKCLVADNQIGYKEETAGGPRVIHEYAQEGLHFVDANKSRVTGATAILGMLGDYNHNVPPRLWISPECRMLIQQLPTLVHDPNHAGYPKPVHADSNGEGGNDCYDAFRYGVMAADHESTRARIVANPLAGFR